eukprot:m.80039 g.80039  ORF g.80039 m.80039 type:complete len:199 (+) comp36159_c0_seq1:456-1052(+)
MHQFSAIFFIGCISFALSRSLHNDTTEPPTTQATKAKPVCNHSKEHHKLTVLLNHPHANRPVKQASTRTPGPCHGHRSHGNPNLHVSLQSEAARLICDVNRDRHPSELQMIDCVLPKADSRTGCSTVEYQGKKNGTFVKIVKFGHWEPIEIAEYMLFRIPGCHKVYTFKKQLVSIGCYCDTTKPDSYGWVQDVAIKPI